MEKLFCLEDPLVTEWYNSPAYKECQVTKFRMGTAQLLCVSFINSPSKNMHFTLHYTQYTVCSHQSHVYKSNGLLL